MSQLTPLILDTECYVNYWLCKTLDPATGIMQEYQLFPDHPLEAIPLRNALTSHTIITFNGNSYDLPIITYALSGATNQQLKAASDDIIQNQLRSWDFYRKYGLTEPTSIDHIDMIEVAPGQGSLKAYGGKMHTRKLQDLPIHPSETIDWWGRAFLREYCGNDLRVTCELWETFPQQITLREQISAEYGVDLRSKSDAQMAEAAMKALLSFKPERPHIAPGTQFYYQPPEWLSFQTPQLQDVLRRMSTLPFVVTPTGGVSPSAHNTLVDWGSDQVRLDAHNNWIKKTAGWTHETVRIGDTIYALGSGGLHSMEASICWRADETRGIRMPDVASYYPSLIKRLGIAPPAIGSSFAGIYSEWYDRRLAAKAAGDKKVANSLKTFLNGTFGKLGSKWSIFYTPSGMIQVTVTGQLALLMLIEMLETSGIPVVSANTDGIVTYAERDMDWLTDHIVAQWEAVTGFVMEMSEFSLLAARDINSYVGLTTDGEVKLKGAFAPPVPGASGWPNPTGQVCVDAVVAYLRDGTPLGDTILACTDIRQFVYVRSVTGGGSYCETSPLPRKTTQTAMRRKYLGVGRDVPKDELLLRYDEAVAQSLMRREYLGKVVRWIYVIGSQGCIISHTGALVPRTQGCRPMMELPNEIPDDLDYDWYIREAESLLLDIGVNR